MLLWYRPAAVFPIQPLAWEAPHAEGEALKSKQNKTKQNKNKQMNPQMGPNQTYELLHSKRNHFKKWKKPLELEKIVANNATDKGLISKVYKQLITLNKQSNQKTDRRPK